MKTTKIEWTEATWNPSVGCNKVTAGCKYCYAEVMAKRLRAMGSAGYEDGFKFKILPERLHQPISIKKPTKFFVNSMSDLFHEKMPFDYLDKILKYASTFLSNINQKRKYPSKIFLRKKSADKCLVGRYRRTRKNKTPNRYFEKYRRKYSFSFNRTFN
jgi:protein gp37